MTKSIVGVMSACAFVAAVSAAADQTFGAGVKLKDATAISALYAQPEKFVGKKVRIDGVVTAVCEEMGCWMALAAKDHPDQTVRFKVDEGKGIVFPTSARGASASAEGTFEKIGTNDKDAMEAAKEQTGAGEFGQRYQIKATGAVVRK